jgi:hypothetical protein
MAPDGRRDPRRGGDRRPGRRWVGRRPMRRLLGEHGSPERLPPHPRADRPRCRHALPSSERAGESGGGPTPPPLTHAVDAYRRIVVVTHVPPFAEAAWHEGQPSAPAWAPFFACQATGVVLLDIARRWADREFVVLCGHSHGAGEYAPLANLRVTHGGRSVWGADRTGRDGRGVILPRPLREAGAPRPRGAPRRGEGRGGRVAAVSHSARRANQRIPDRDVEFRWGVGIRRGGIEHRALPDRSHPIELSFRMSRVTIARSSHVAIGADCS